MVCIEFSNHNEINSDTGIGKSARGVGLQISFLLILNVVCNWINSKVATDNIKNGDECSHYDTNNVEEFLDIFKGRDNQFDEIPCFWKYSQPVKHFDP